MSLWNPFFTFLTGLFLAASHHRPSSGTGQKEEVASDFINSSTQLSVCLWSCFLALSSILSTACLKSYQPEAQVAAAAVTIFGTFYRDYSLVAFQCHLVFVRLSWFDQTIYVSHTPITSALIAVLTDFLIWSLWFSRAWWRRTRARELLQPIGFYQDFFLFCSTKD